MAVALESYEGPIRMTKPPVSPDPDKHAQGELQVEFGARVRAAREKVGWLQRDLGAHCGLTQMAISKIEAGQKNVTLRTMRRLAAALDLPIPELLQANETAPKPKKRRST